MQLVEIFRGSIPFLLLVLVAMVLVYVFPQTVYYLPTLFYAR